MIAYGILGQVWDVDADKVYDYHTVFDIKPTEVSFNVDINANEKKILNIALDRNSDDSAATVKMVKELKLLLQKKTICTENFLKTFMTSVMQATINWQKELRELLLQGLILMWHFRSRTWV